MNMKKENFGFYIKLRTGLNIPTRTIHDELCSVFGDHVPALRMMEW